MPIDVIGAAFIGRAVDLKTSQAGKPWLPIKVTPADKAAGHKACLVATPYKTVRPWRLGKARGEAGPPELP